MGSKDIDMSATPAAARCVEWHVRVLRAVGFYRSPAGAAGAAGAGAGAYRGAVLALTSGYLLQELVHAWRVRADMPALTRVMFLLLCHVTSLAKQFVFLWRADDIDAMVRLLHDPRLNPGGARARRRLAAAARGAARLARLYAGTAVLTCSLWTGYAASRRDSDFPFWSPAGLADSAAGFWALLLYSFWVTTLVGVANTTMDAYMAAILLQASVQCSILCDDLGDLMERAEQRVRAAGAAGAVVTAGDFDDTAMTMFLECLDHYKKIIRIPDALLEIFGGAILVQFAIGGWILCMAAYQLVVMSAASVQLASMVLFIVCILTELLLYCWSGNEVAVCCAAVPGALWRMRWRRGPRALRRALLLTLTRTQRAPRLRAAHLVPLSLETFIAILKSSYTCYAVLRQTKEE